MRAVAMLVLVAAAGFSASGEEPNWKRHGCTHGHPSRVAYRMVGELLRNYRPLTRRTKRRVHHYAVCVATRAKSHEAHERARGHYRWRHSYGPYWRIVFNGMPWGERVWARSTGECESGNDPAAHSENGDHGGMQFKLATAWAAGFTRDPHLTSLYEQYVRAIWWKWRTSDEQWPVCGD